MPENDSGPGHDSGPEATTPAPNRWRLGKLPLAPTLLGVGTILWKLAGLAERVDFILRVQDETFAAIFEAFISYGWIILILGSVLWGIYAAWKQSAPIEDGFKATPGMVLSVGLLAFLYGILIAVRATGAIPNVTVAWGPSGNGCQLAVDTSRLATFRSQYYLVGVCGLNDPATDMLQQTNISISKPFTITPGGVRVFAPYSAAMTNALKGMVAPGVTTPDVVVPPNGATSTGGTSAAGTVSLNIWYQPVLVPKDTDFSKVTTLSDIKKQGGKILNPAYFE